jgi:hypothetical protein
VFEADIKPVAGVVPGVVSFASSQASGGWTHSVCRFGLTNNGFYYGTGDASTSISTNLNYSNGNWYHIRMVLDRVNKLFYVNFNGTLIDSAGYPAANVTPEWFSLGAENNGQNTMYFDNISIYSVDSDVCVTD